MIVVVGRPELDERGELAGLTGTIAAAAARTGARVEVVGSVTDDGRGDETIVALGRARVHHAALLRMQGAERPRLEAADIELGLSYVADCRVVVIADELDAAALSATVDGARYHGASLIVAAPVSVEDASLPDDATVLAEPAHGGDAFADLVGRYAAQLDSGTAAADAWRDAVAATGWEQSGDSQEDE